MMKVTEKRKKQSSLGHHQNIRKAAFVPLGTEENKITKYFKVYTINVALNKLLTSFRNLCKKNVGKIRLWAEGRDWQGMWRDTIYWLINATIEGFTANFATHYLFGWNFNPMTMIAHGCVINQGISIYWRLKKDGQNSRILTKDK